MANSLATKHYGNKNLINVAAAPEVPLTIMDPTIGNNLRRHNTLGYGYYTVHARLVAPATSATIQIYSIEDAGGTEIIGAVRNALFTVGANGLAESVHCRGSRTMGFAVETIVGAGSVNVIQSAIKDVD